MVLIESLQSLPKEVILAVPSHAESCNVLLKGMYQWHLASIVV